MPDDRLHFPATERNREPLLEVLTGVLPPSGLVLEIASGSGEHGAFFAPRLPGLTWQPSDLDPRHRASIAAWRAHVGAPNLREPVPIDVTEVTWPVTHADAIFCANLIHIAPWEATLGLLDGAARLLPAGGRLVLYGPFRVDGAHKAPSNEAFDASLRARDPRWGVRDLAEVAREADSRGLRLTRTVSMPANNLTVVFERAGL